ncbi:MAG: exonuclease SbcCD subunit D [Oscillospiraceae bacterium]|nr:exonuclease SbcCD subunit D [Oscillospiraceae bacterium]
MKFLHLADLHFGKSIHGVSLLENGDQPVWVQRFLDLATDLAPDAVVIAGDVYDRAAPSGDAVALLDRFITGLADLDIPVLMVPGNHDSGQRMSFASRLLAKQQVHIASVLTKELTHVTLTDQDGPVTFWLMPYVFPALVAQRLGDDSIRDYDTAVRRLLAAQKLDFSQRNVLVAHQNVVVNGQESVRGGSESMVGGVGQVDYHAFDGFDYVALGHIHAAYPVGRDTVRYAGSPMCYHFNELNQPQKGPILVELGAKGSTPGMKTQIIQPLHPMREVKGAYAELRESELHNETRGEYVRVVLTDRRPSPHIYKFFQEMYGNRDGRLMELLSEYRPFEPVSGPAQGIEDKTVEELFLGFYRERRDGMEPDGPERALLRFAADQVRRMNRDEDKLEWERQSAALLKFALGQEDEE